MRTPPVKPFLPCLLLWLALLGGLARAADGSPVSVEVVADLDEPWAMAFLPDGRLLVTEKRGSLKLVDRDGGVAAVSGTPTVDYGGQGGLGDVALHPGFADNRLVYLSYVETGEGGRGAVVARARLATHRDGGELRDLEVIWRQQPKVGGRGHYGHRIVFGPAGHLWISSGDRQKFTPAQDMQGNLGKILRLDADGGVPSDNPFADRGGVTAQIWSLGHRNPLGLAFDPDGVLWCVEMGPRGGDELNRVERGANYGYPEVSEGDHYDGTAIPRHATRTDITPPVIAWTPVISPSSLVFYDGSEFPGWRGSAIISGLSARGLVRVAFDGDVAREVQRVPLEARIRAVEQGPDGALWVLEDEKRGSLGRLLRLSRP